MGILLHDAKRKYTKYEMVMQVGAADYIALAQHYHTVFITDIPIMSMRMIDKVRNGVSALFFAHFWKLPNYLNL